MFLRARYYDPSVGRFMSQDACPGSAGSPLSLNRYTYVLNSPTLTADPSGMTPSNKALQPHDCTNITDKYAPTCAPSGPEVCIPGSGCLAMAGILKNLGNGDDCIVGPGANPTEEELAAGRAAARYGYRIEFRAPGTIRSPAGGTADVLVNGLPYDTYTPRSDDPQRIIEGIRDKDNQAVGVILNLSRSKVASNRLGDQSAILAKVRALGARNIKDIIVVNK